MSISRTIRGWLCGLVVCGLLGADHTKGVELQPRDVWYAYLLQNDRYGYEHVIVRRLDDGNFSYEVESRVLLEFFGQRQELVEKGKYLVTPQLEPVSVELETQQPSGKTQVRGHVDGRRLVVSWQRDELRREVTFDLNRDTTFAVCLEDWLQRQTADKATCDLIDAASLIRETVHATRRPRNEATTGTAWTIQSESLGQGEIVLDRDGIRQEMRFRAPPACLTRITADEARDIRPQKMSDRQLLTFPVEPAIALPGTLTALTVRLKWKDLPWEQLALEDERQHIVRHSENDGRHEVVLRIEQPKPFETAQGYPIDGEEFLQYLAETRFIKPKDPAIVRQARAWADKETTALGAVLALSRGVFQHMQGGTLIAETLTGPEVLEGRKGKCSEYTVLFASLARSLGIPTRVVLGMRLLQGSWVGHMWAEAYVGRWITVDATTDEVGHVPTLLKLVHSDRVLGTQAVRWGVTESLQVAIDDFAPRPTAGRYKTGVDGSVYTNAELRCRLTAPHNDWTIVDARRGPMHPPTVRFKVPGHDDVLIHFVPLSLPPALTPTMLVDARLARFKAVHKEFEVLKNEPYLLQQMQGRILVFRDLKEKPTPTRMKTTEILWQNKSGIFLLNLIATEASHDEYLADFFKLLNSFKILPETQAK